ncbi:MAG TPA: hypothetical protein VFF73_04035 [Planctomycetota bacterium]|nr:hypothetical protein [Planctomycetota bacterium]
MLLLILFLVLFLLPMLFLMPFLLLILFRSSSLRKTHAKMARMDGCVLESVRVSQSTVRCPYCHDTVSPEAESWLACRACLARHHTDCWNESLRCSTCGSGTALVTEVTTFAGRAESATEKRRRLLRVHFRWAVLLLASLVANVVLAWVLLHQPTSLPF